MSKQLNQSHSLLLAALPLIILVCSTGLAGWQGVQSHPLVIGSYPRLHQSITNLPVDMNSKATEKQQAISRQNLTDPFFRYRKPMPEKNVVKVMNLEEIQLTTIAQGENGRYCIVNGKIFHENQSGKGFIVKKISREKVAFQTSLDNFSLLPGQKTAVQAGKQVPVKKMTKTSQPALNEESVVSDLQQSI